MYEVWHILLQDTLATANMSLRLGGFAVGDLQCLDLFKMQELTTSLKKSVCIVSIFHSYDRNTFLQCSELAVTQPCRALKLMKRPSPEAGGCPGRVRAPPAPLR